MSSCQKNETVQEARLNLFLTCKEKPLIWSVNLFNQSKQKYKRYSFIMDFFVVPYFALTFINAIVYLNFRHEQLDQWKK